MAVSAIWELSQRLLDSGQVNLNEARRFRDEQMTEVQRQDFINHCA